MKRLVLVLTWLLLCTAPSFAQGDLFTGYTLIDLDSGAQETAHGFAFSATAFVQDWYGIEGDFAYTTRGLLLGVGPKFRTTKEGPVVAYFHAMYGLSHLELRTLAIPRPTRTDTTAILGGGAEFAMGDRTAWRVGADYVPVFTSRETRGHVRFVTGIVWRLGD